MPDRKNAGSAVPTDLRFYGTATPSQNNALVLPKLAREELSLDGQGPVFIFGSPSRQQAIIAASPPAQDLMSLLAQATSKGPQGT